MTAGEFQRLAGVWSNQLGSRLLLEVDADGRLSGSMHSSVGGVAGEHPLSGFARSSGEGRGVIGFVVAWDQTSSVTSWSGHYDLRTGTISVNWLLTGNEFDENEWQATRVGHDHFWRDVLADTRPANVEAQRASVPSDSR